MVESNRKKTPWLANGRWVAATLQVFTRVIQRGVVYIWHYVPCKVIKCDDVWSIEWPHRGGIYENCDRNQILSDDVKYLRNFGGVATRRPNEYWKSQGEENVTILSRISSPEDQTKYNWFIWISILFFVISSHTSQSHTDLGHFTILKPDGPVSIHRLQILSPVHFLTQNAGWPTNNSSTIITNFQPSSCVRDPITSILVYMITSVL